MWDHRISKATHVHAHTSICPLTQPCMCRHVTRHAQTHFQSAY
uniref:Uncharacterized protein n=1 Tax=Manihot esculenta TaxID=3983 RepID=A0A2C9UGW7_MANES